MRCRMMIGCALGLMLAISAGSAARAEGNIDKVEKFAWSENVGWINFAPANGGVTIDAPSLTGYAWAENIGWVKMAAEDSTYLNTTKDNWGVKSVGTVLQGFAWSENAGWINFAPVNGGVTMQDGLLDGYAWSENVGWIHFRNATPFYGVTTKMKAGTLISIR